MSYLNGTDSFINEEVSSQEGELFWEEPYQVLPDSPEMDDAVYQENSEKVADTYDQFVSAEVFLPDEQGRKFMVRVTKHVKENDVNSRGIEDPTFFVDQ